MYSDNSLQRALSARLKKIYQPTTETVRIPGKKRIIEEKVPDQKTVSEKEVRKRPYWIPAFLFSAGILALVYFSINGPITYGYYSAGAGAVIGLVLFFAFYYTRIIEVSKVVKFERTIQKEVQDEDTFENRLSESKKKITEIGKGSLKFDVTRVNGRKILITNDFDLTVQNLAYDLLENDDAVKETHGDMQEMMTKLPYVLEAEEEVFDITARTTYGDTIRLKGLEKDVMHHFEFMNEEFRKLDSESFHISTIQDKKLFGYLQNSEHPEENIQAQHLKQTVESDRGIETDDMAEEWLQFWKQANRLMDEIRITSLSEDISTEFLKLGRMTNYSCFNFYCPECNEDVFQDIAKRNYSVQSKSQNKEIYLSGNTKCTVNLQTSKWRCPACEKEFSNVIPIHKTLNEVFLPVFDKLMEENKVQREQTNSEVRKKEIEFRNEMKKEIDKMYYDNISGILALRDDMDRMKAEIDGELEAINLMETLGQKHIEKQSEIIGEINRINSSIKEKVQGKIDAVIQQVDQYMQGEMDQFKDKMHQLAEAQKVNDQKRDDIMKGILEETMNQSSILEQGFSDLSFKMDEAQALGQEQLVAAQQGNQIIDQQLGAVNNNIMVSNMINAAMAQQQGVELSNQEDWKDALKQLNELKPR